jgi:hypothetical protein
MGIYDVTALESVEGVVTAVHWTYTNDEGSISGVHTLPVPAGDVPFVGVTEVVSESWLIATLPNTSEELDDAIASRNVEPIEPTITYFHDLNVLPN